MVSFWAATIDRKAVRKTIFGVWSTYNAAQQHSRWVAGPSAVGGEGWQWASGSLLLSFPGFVWQLIDRKERRWLLRVVKGLFGGYWVVGTGSKVEVG